MQWRIGDYGKYESFIHDTERRYGIPVNLLGVTLYQASKYDPDHIAGRGRNPVGVIGIANLTKENCTDLWAGKDRRTDPLASIVGCALLLRAQFHRFHNWKHALLAYHSDATIVRDNLHKGIVMPIRAREYTQQAEAYARLT